MINKINKILRFPFQIFCTILLIPIFLGMLPAAIGWGNVVELLNCMSDGLEHIWS